MRHSIHAWRILHPLHPWLLLPLALTGLLLAGCDSGDKPQVKTDFDPKVNFAQYHTFAFQTGKIVSVAGVNDTNNTLVDNRIRDAVNAQLPSKGLQAVSQNPDLVATYIAGAQTKQQIEDLGPSPYASSYFGGPFSMRSGGSWWGPNYDRFYVQNYTQGTLILDLIDPKTKQLVWRAYVTGPFTQPDEKTIRKAVAAALQDFPPQPKS